MPHTLKISTSGPQLSSSNSSPDSPYYPVRHTGASQRRAQRSPLASPGSQYCSSPDTPTTPRYQSPYVEDVVSPIQEAKKPDGGHQFHSTAHGGRDSQSGCLHRSTEDHSSDISQEVSDGSTEGHASTDDSAQSTGSKSVKFRSKVDIRLSDSRTSSNASSHAKILEEDIKPDDDTIPSRVGIYGTSPVKSQNGYYPRAPGSHKVPSSAAVEDGYVEPILERSYRGAFSKDSPASSWLPPTSNAGGDYWYSRPSTYHSTTTPSPTTEGFKGFRPGGHSTFNYGSKSGNGNENGAPPLRTTGDTFNPTNADTTKERESQKTPLSPTSGSQSQGPPESSGSSWRYYTSPFGGDQKAESTFKKTSPWSNFSSRSDPECHTMQDDSSFSQSAFSDYSQPSTNPYYEPRKRTFPDINDYCFFGTRTHRTPGKWAKDYQSATKLPKPTPYWIPEPIIEEPDSPESSPGKKSNMLGKLITPRHSCQVFIFNHSQNLTTSTSLLHLSAILPLTRRLIQQRVKLISLDPKSSWTTSLIKRTLPAKTAMTSHLLSRFVRDLQSWGRWVIYNCCSTFISFLMIAIVAVDEPRLICMDFFSFSRLLHDVFNRPKLLLRCYFFFSFFETWHTCLNVIACCHDQGKSGMLVIARGEGWTL